MADRVSIGVESRNGPMQSNFVYIRLRIKEQAGILSLDVSTIECYDPRIRARPADAQ